ncbi:hypothetical protein [Natronococcus sp. A-GB7]|uniref:hypothetical protein n=1 Tax=Natronococcus sp. A-GB7 TaxID=3037649 RepID=UPI0024201727|nr:hypothetical protein [Natronococcus sp. A-GB7]MDG5819383.1 hypothetical protein [Natronococcus sp. A-GB7]
MTDYDCPLCSNDYEERTDLRIHLEVNHRKSAIVSELIEASAATDSAAGSDELVLERDRPAPPL